MPMVRAKREVSLNPLPGVRKTAAETPISRGAGVAAAEIGVAHAMGDVGELASRIGVAQFTKIKQEEREKANQVAALAISNYWSKFEADYFHGDNGVLKKQGKDALGVPEDYEAAYTKAKGVADAMATTAEQKQDAERIAARTYQNGYATARRHTFTQMQEFGKGELNAKVKNAANAAVVNAHDPARVAMEISEGEFALRNVAPQFGAGPKEIEEMVGTFKSQALGGVITKLITDGFDIEAKVYFEEHQKEITDATVLNQIGEKVKRATTDALGERAADEIWKQHAPNPNDDTAPISLDKMETAAREKWGDNTLALKATISALRDRKQGVNDGRRERLNAQDGAIWGAIFKGASLNDLKRTEAFVNAPGEVQQKVGEYFRREAEHQESLAASREGRAAARESREYTAQARKEQQLELDNWSAMWGYSDPETLRKLTPEQLMAKLPELGHAHVGRLLQEQAKIKKDDSTFRAAVIDRDLFNAVMQEAGVPGVYDPPAKRSPEERADLGKLLSTIEEAIGRKQVAAGRRLTREETEQVARETVDAKVLVKEGWFSSGGYGSSAKYPVLLTIDDVPPAAAAALRAKFKARGPDEPTAQDIIDAYALTLKKAPK